VILIDPSIKINLQAPAFDGSMTQEAKAAFGEAGRAAEELEGSVE
jgi:hypothetical protein